MTKTPIIYYQDKRLTIRSMIPEDTQIIFNMYASYGWNPSIKTYTDYLQQQENNERLVFIPEYDGEVAGTCSLVFHPTEGPWANMNYPEIVDFTIFYHLHNKGIGNKLLDAVEKEAAAKSNMVYLAVGLHSGYGPAQRIYTKRGYICDGSGVWYKGKVLDYEAPCINDDDLLLYLSKKLK